MTVGFECNDKIIANADLSIVPSVTERVVIWGKNYYVIHIKHEVEIKQKASGKKSVTEKIICQVMALDD